MGITLHFQLHLPTEDPAEARRLLLALHGHAATLGFATLSPLYEIDPTDDPPAEGVEPVTEPDGIALFRRLVTIHQPRVGTQAATQHHADLLGLGPATAVEIHADDWIGVAPEGPFVCFVASDPGTEPARFALARHPAEVDGQPTGLGPGSGHHGRAFCKTQYAGLPKHGGPQNFLTAHTRLVHLLDHAKHLGARVEIEDETGYADHRDEPRLLATLEQHMRLTAAATGALTDHLESRGVPRETIHAAMHQHPDFEHLEADGVKCLEGRGGGHPA